LDKAQTWGERVYVDPQQKAEFDAKIEYYRALTKKASEKQGQQPKGEWVKKLDEQGNIYNEYIVPKEGDKTPYIQELDKEKDSRSTFEKDSTYLSRVTGMSEADAANALRSDKTLGDRLQLAKAQIESIQGSFLPPDEEESAIKEVLTTMGLDNPETMGLPRSAQGVGDNKQSGERRVVRTGVDKSSGKKVVQYDDGTVEYAE
jgi:hypothetical protein